MRRDHPLAARPHFAAEHFADETLVMYNSPYQGFTFEKVLEPAGVRPKRIIEVQLTEGIVDAIHSAGEQLRTFFPRAHDDVNELANEINIEQ